MKFQKAHFLEVKLNPKIDYNWKLMNILADASGELSERQLRELYKRKSTLAPELKILIDKKFIVRSKSGRVFFYKIVPGAKELHEAKPRQIPINSVDDMPDKYYETEDSEHTKKLKQMLGGK